MSMQGAKRDEREHTETIPARLEFTDAEKDEMIRLLTDQAGALELEITAALAIAKTMHKMLHLLTSRQP